MSHTGLDGRAAALFAEMSNVCDWAPAEPRVRADLHLLSASIRSRERSYLRAAAAVYRALVARSMAIGRPAKPLLRRLKSRTAKRQTVA